jgi:nucleoside-diphosphate-sugar epimerase
MKKIAVIGGSGFVGTRLIELLLKQSSELLNIDKQPSVFYPDITVIGNVLNGEQLAGYLKGVDLVVLLAAEHRDDVSPTSLYYDVNVEGMKHTLTAMAENHITRIVFTSSVAIYGLNKENPDEGHPADPFNHYGKSKWQAEQVLQEWYRSHPDWNINILRPTVIFGERNRGNVYNLLKQISSGKFMMVGSGNNKKSMAYVGNIVAFIRHLIENRKEGYNVYNYIDKPDLTMNELVSHVGRVLKKQIPSVHLPYALGMLGGYVFDFLAWVTGKKLSIRSVRIRKFNATTQFNATKALSAGFQPPYSLEKGLARTLEFEFIRDASEGVVFYSE